MVNEEADPFIRACANFQLVNSFYRESQQLLHTIELDAPFDVVFIYFWKQGDFQDRDYSCKILTLLGCITLYNRIWDSDSHWTEGMYIIIGHTMGFWKLICHI